MSHIIATSKHTRRGVAGGRWPKTIGVERVRPLAGENWKAGSVSLKWHVGKRNAAWTVEKRKAA